MRLTPGALLLRYRQTFGHGLSAAWYRDVVRPRILKTAPVTGTTDPTAEIHVLTRAPDFLDLIWALKSFYRASARSYKLCIHDDGSLCPDQRHAIKAHFPDARVVSRQEADRLVHARLREFPRCLEFRRTNVLAPKVFDFAAFLESERMLLFDSDLLFFETPSALLQRIEDLSYRLNAFNADCGHGYTVDPQNVRERIGHELVPRINSGLGLMHRGSIRIDWCEEFLQLPGIFEGHFWRIEQTLIALCSSRFGVELLPAEYTLRLEPGIEQRPFRHYVGAIRHLLYSEGIPALLKRGILRGAAAPGSGISPMPTVASARVSPTSRNEA